METTQARSSATPAGADPGDLGLRLVRRRQALGLDPGEVAQRAGIDPGYLRYLERQAAATPDWSTKDRLARALDTSVARLGGGQGGHARPAAPILASRDELAVHQLDPHACRRLLASKQVGRLGVVVEGRPQIFPVNYALDAAGAVVFATSPGTKLNAALNHHVVFEVDEVGGDSPGNGSGWSVVIHGIAHHTDPRTLRFAGRPFQPWLLDREYMMRIHPNKVTGRRLSPSPPGNWADEDNGDDDRGISAGNGYDNDEERDEQ